MKSWIVTRMSQEGHQREVMTRMYRSAWARLVMPVGPGGDEEVIAYRKVQGHLQQVERLCHAFFVPLVGRHGLHAR